MKKLMTILMCFQMIVAPVAFAADKEKTTNASSQFQSNPDAKASANYLNQILSISQAAVGTTVITSCRFGLMLMSLKLYMAGSVAYIASEMLGAKEQKKNLEKKSADIKMVAEKMKNGNGGGEVQKEALEQALKEQQDTLKFIKQRKMWLMAISAIYAAAAILALTEKVKVVAAEAAKPGGGAVLVPAYMLSGCVATGGAAATTIGKVVAAAYSFGISNTSSGMIGKYGSMAVAFAATIPAVATKILTVINTPTGRAAIFGATGALTLLNMTSLGSKGKAVEENIKLLEAAIKDFKANSTDTNAIATDTSTTSGSTSGSSAEVATTSGSGSGTSSAINSLASGVSTNSPNQCWAQTPNGYEYTTSGCSTPIKVSTSGLGGTLDLPTLSSASSSAENLANALNSGNSAAADVEAGKLASMAGRLNQIKENVLKQVNDQLKANGQSPINLDDEVRQQLAGMNGAMNSALGTSHPTVLPPDVASAVSVSPDDTKSTNGKIANIQTGNAGSAIAAPKPATPSLTEGISDGTMSEADKAALAESLKNEYEVSANDISTDKNGASLFQQLSNRYLLNYPKIFEKQKLVPEKAAVPAQKPQ